MKGVLIAVEGIDGSGKTTHVGLLRQWLEEIGEKVFLTVWNSSDVVRATTRRGKKQNLLTPTTFSLLHATDFADRYERMIDPHLAAGYIVLADRYAFTGRTRDAARGVSPKWVENLYSFARRPDLTFYIRVSPRTALRRVLTSRGTLGFYEAGMDLGLDREPARSFIRFQQRITDAYERLVAAKGFVILDGENVIAREQARMRDRVRDLLKERSVLGEETEGEAPDFPRGWHPGGGEAASRKAYRH